MNSARKKRGTGILKKATSRTQLPGKWKDFLAQCRKQTRIITFLSKKVACTKFLPEKEVTCSHNVLVNGSDYSMPNCNYEEADTRMFFFSSKGCFGTWIFIMSCCTVDTNVVVILSGKFHQFRDRHHMVNIWVAFGTKNHYLNLHINTIAQVLGREKSSALPIFHSFTGCDTVSPSLRKGRNQHGRRGNVSQMLQKHSTA